MKDMRGGDRARWICDALHSIMLMRRIIMSPPLRLWRYSVGTSVFHF